MFKIFPPSTSQLDILHFDISTFCQDYSKSIFKSIMFQNGRIFRVKWNDNSTKLYKQFHEIIFGNLYAREIIFRYLEKYGSKINMYNVRLIELLTNEYRYEILHSPYIPILREFKSEPKLLDHFEQHQRLYLHKLFFERDGFKFYKVDNIEIETDGPKIIQPVVYTKYADRILAVDYFKTSPIDKTTSAHIIYPADMVLLLQHIARNTKIRYVRVFNMYNNLHSIINIKKYKKLFLNKRDLKGLYERLRKVDPEPYIEAYGSYIPSLWTYQCYGCQMHHICFAYQFRQAKRLFGKGG